VVAENAGRGVTHRSRRRGEDPPARRQAGRPGEGRRSERAGKRRGWWPWAIVAVLLLALCLGWLLLPLRAWVEASQSWLLRLGPWGVLLFGLVLVVITFLPAPDWPMPIAAGYVYGVWGFPLTYAAIAFASSLAFLAARHLARDRIRALLKRQPKYRAFDKAIEEEGWRVVVLLRLSPILPFNLQNYALGATAIPFVQYLIATLLGIIPGIAIYVYFGIFGKGLLQSGPNILDWVVFGFGILAATVLAILVARQANAKFTEQE
jgi:uncharacterized membrane protein YdjX (TVP38/TMEM64 family)